MFIPLNWLYLWQIKEYRLDRFRSHLRSLSWKKRIRLFLWGDIRKPTFTPKMVVITFLSIGLSLLLWIYLVEVSSLTVFNAIVMGFISWYCSSVIITCCVGIVFLIERPIKQYVISAAHQKSKTFFDNTRIIGITGSYGKTTTKEFLGTILSKEKNAVITPEHVNQTLPLAKFINSLKEPPELLIVEYASYGIGNIKYDIEHVLRPNWAIFTGIAPQHLELFGSIDNIITAKLELADGLPDDGIIFYNSDDERLAAVFLNDNKHEVIPFSAQIADEFFETITWKDTLKGKIVQQLFATNVAAAISVGRKLGLSEESIRNGLEDISWLSRTVEPIEKSRFSIIDDSYSSNEAGFQKIISLAGTLDYPKKILVTHGVIELGSEAFSINKALSGQAEAVFDVVLVTNPSVTEAWTREESDKIITGTVENLMGAFNDALVENALVVIEGRIYESMRSFILNYRN